MSAFPRRRILYIRHQRSKDIADNFRFNQDEWCAALALHADVILQEDDFDLDEICDRERPDFIIYESPLFHPRPLKIENPRAHSHIPRIGFFMQDPYCAMRVPFLRVMEALGGEWIFTHMTETLLHQSPEFAARTFSTPLIFDEDLFHDCGLEKDIPVSVFGGFLMPEVYNWRARMARDLPRRLPTFIYTHPGYEKPAPRHKFAVTGEAYARMLSRSHFSIADTTYFDCLVRKHLEIPAAGAVLVAPDASVLKPYGFIDMKNCLLGKGEALLDKIAAVADDPALYEKIRLAGHRLVHSRYGRRQWRALIDFYECLRNLKPEETIRQQGMLGDFVAVPRNQAPAAAIIADVTDNAIAGLAKQWMRHIIDPQAMAESVDKPEWIEHTSEPLVLLGLMAALRGDVEQACRLIQAPRILRLQQGGFDSYDPEEIAWLSLLASLQGDAELLALTQKQAAGMRHLSLRRMRWLGQFFAQPHTPADPAADILGRAAQDQISVHWTGQWSWQDWLNVVARILTANGQAELAASLHARKI